MRPQHEFDAVLTLVRQGLNDCQISRRTGIPRGTIRDWRVRGRGFRSTDADCPRCARAPLVVPAYPYLLGLYLGDGYVATHRRTYVLRLTLDARYPAIIDEAAGAVAAMRPSIGARVWRIDHGGWIELASGWNHWPCLFPQHGPGPKHRRPIELRDWQDVEAMRYPFAMLRGLVQSDGCRVLNRVWKGKYTYPRYLFSNESNGIRRIFERACAAGGVGYRYSKPNTISIARREDVALLDRHIGAKT